MTVDIKCRICTIFNRQWSVGVIGTRASVCAVLESVIVSVIVLMLWYVSVSTIVVVPVPELVTV